MADVFDIETNGLLPTMDKIHCIHVGNTETGIIDRYSDQDPKALGSIKLGLKRLEEAECIVGHNIEEFDILAIRKVYPNFKPKGLVRDTLIISRLIWTDLKDKDFKHARKNASFPMHLVGRHSLESWGARLKFPKDDYSKKMKEQGLDPWVEWNPLMADYCDQDVRISMKFWKLIQNKNYSEEAIQLEHDVRRIVFRQEQHGVAFDERACSALYAELVARREELKARLQLSFPAWYANAGRFTPKVNNKKAGYTAGAELCKVKLMVFNPSSRMHIANRLTVRYGWEPTVFTPSGEAQVDETILKKLKYPEAKDLVEYLLVDKRIGQIAEGKQAWLKSVKADGRIHGGVSTNGAVTGRMTHSKPNLANVPAVDAPYGTECRACFIVPKGKKLVGADAAGLEIRVLAHYMARWDNGAYTKVVLEGDIHEVNREAAGLPSRPQAKTFFYAFLYGGGDSKIGSIVKKGAKVGRALKEKFLQGLPALAKLQKAIKKAVKTKGYVVGLDGRLLHIRSMHAALNTLLQGGGAIVMKRALVILDAALQAMGYVPGVNYEFVLNVHDEWQLEVDEDIAEDVGIEAVKAIREAGEWYKFRCPLDGEYKVGNNWAETH